MPVKPKKENQCRLLSESQSEHYEFKTTIGTKG